MNITNYQWIIQKWYPINFKASANRLIQRLNTEELSYNFYDWNIYDNNIIDKLYGDGLDRNYLSQDYNSIKILSNNEDFNTLNETGLYLNTSLENPNMPFYTNNGGLLTVETYYKNGDTFRWIIQTYRNITLTKMAQRIFRQRILGSPENEIIIDSDWKLLYNNSENEGFGLNNKTIVNFGDSIFGNYQDETSVSNNIASIINANVINMGFGGTRISQRNETFWNAFSMCNLAHSIVTKDFTLQDTALQNKPQGEWVPLYYESSLQTLKNIDFSKIDYITIAFGTNDYTAGVLLDNEINKYDKTTFAGALRYSIETLLTTYPNLRILIGTPIWRCWLNDQKTQISQTSDERTFSPGNYTLPQLVEKIQEIGKTYHIPVLNTYDNLSLNKFNWSSFYNNDDTTHPIAYGRACLGKEYAYALCNM